MPAPDLLQDIVELVVFLAGVAGALTAGFLLLRRLFRSDELASLRERLDAVRSFQQPIAQRSARLSGLSSGSSEDPLQRQLVAALQLAEAVAARFPLATEALEAKRVTRAGRLVGALEREAPKAALELAGLAGVLAPPAADVAGAGQAGEPAELLTLARSYAKRYIKLNRGACWADRIADQEKHAHWPNSEILYWRKRLKGAVKASRGRLTQFPSTPHVAESVLQEAEGVLKAFRRACWKDLLFNFHKHPESLDTDD